MIHVALVAHGNQKANKLFELTAARDDVLERFYLLKKSIQLADMDCQTLDMFTSNSADVLIFHDILHELESILKVVKANPYVQLIYVPNEPALVTPLHNEKIIPQLPVDVVLTWNDRIAGKFPHVIKCNIGEPVIEKDKIPNVPVLDKKFICSIFANKPSTTSGSLFSERIRSIDFFSRQPLGVDLYGVGWDNSAYSFVHTVYRGACKNKKEVQQQYKFSLAYENVEKIPGLITEKILDCFAAGTVPIYLGASNIEHYIPASCFINFRHFTDYKELYNYLANMSEREYQSYLDAAKGFIDSPQYEIFTSKHYVNVMLEQVRTLVSRKASPRSLIKFKWQLLKAIACYPQALRHWHRYKHFLTALVMIW